MNITITEKELEAFVQEKVQSGAYQSADELVSILLHLLKTREDKFEALRKELLRGVEDIKQGRFTTYTADEDFDELAESIIREGKERKTKSEIECKA
jgi:putative addiction module CopG family antidote